MKLSTCSALVLMVLALSACGGGGGGGNVTAGANMPDTPGGTGGGGTGGGGTGGGGTGGGGTGGGTVTPRPTTPPQSAGAVTLAVDLTTLAGDQDISGVPPDPTPSNLAWNIWEDTGVDDMGDRVDADRPQTAGTTASFSAELLILEGESGCEIESLGCRKIAYVDYVAATNLSDDVDDGYGSNLYRLIHLNQSNKITTPGTLTWEGEYTGHYRIYEEGAWSIFYSDSGRVTLTADLSSNVARSGRIRFVSENTGRRALYDFAEDERTDRVTVDVQFKNTGTFDSRGLGIQDQEIAGGLFGTDGRSTAGVYRFEFSQSIQAIGIFGGCRDDDDSGDGVFPCGTFAEVPDEAPGEDGGNGGTGGSTTHMFSYGPWAEKPSDLVSEDAANGVYVAQLDSVGQYYLSGSPTAASTVGAMTGTATWEGTYQGKYRVSPNGESEYRIDGTEISFASDSGTAVFTADFSDESVTLTLTSDSNMSFPGQNSQNIDEAASSYVFDQSAYIVQNSENQFSGIGRFGGRMRGGFFGSNAQEVGGVYEIDDQVLSSTGEQVEAVGTFTAEKDE